MEFPVCAKCVVGRTLLKKPQKVRKYCKKNLFDSQG